MSDATWADKSPEDMTNDELLAAKSQVQTDFGPVQDKANLLAAMRDGLDREIAKRYQMTSPGTVVAGLGTTTWPTEAVQAAYGSEAAG